MKKNVMMRVASIMLVLVLMSSSVISGTFAKYVTDGTATDNARVAKFGVKVIGSTDIFDATYAKTDVDYAGTLSVEAGMNAVAPGTTKGMAAFDISGTPEVATRVTFSATVELDKWEIAGAYYCPLIVKVVNKVGATPVTTVVKGLDYTNMTAFEDAIEAAVASVKKDYDANTDLSGVEDDIEISWEWPFENPTDATLQGTAQWQSDVKDTALGDQAADDNAATIKIDVTCTVTQID